MSDKMKWRFAIGILGLSVAMSTLAAPGGNKPPKEPSDPPLSGLQAFSGGQSLGYVLYAGGDLDATVGLLSSNGYLYELKVSDGTLIRGYWSLLYFPANNCTGQAYARRSWKAYQGHVFAVGASQLTDFAYYTPRGGEAVYFYYVSYVEGGVCRNVSGAAFVVPAFPNDPVVTGVAGTDYDWPIVFGRP